MPGLGTLITGRNADVLPVSCPSPGYCAAGGYYGNHSRNPYDVTTGRGFVVSERGGRWHRAVRVHGLRALNKGGNAHVSSVSCASAGNCAAGGSYDGFGSGAWVVRETNGAWGKQTAVPGLGALNKGKPLGVSSVSCASAGSRVAGGYYQEAGSRYALQGFVT